MEEILNKERRLLMVLIQACLVLALAHEAHAAGLEADLVIYNGKFLTADNPDPNRFAIAEAAAIYGGKFAAVGTNTDILQFAGSKTQKIDLGGRTVIPGIVETHDHIYSYASHFFPTDKPLVRRRDPAIAWTNKKEFLAQIRTLALNKKPGEWVITTMKSGFMGLVKDLQNGKVTRFDLDQAAPETPVSLYWVVDNEGLVNTKALNLLLARHPHIPGVLRDEHGVPTGRLTGVAKQALEYEFWPLLPPEQLAPYYKMEMEEIAAQGITTVSTRLYPNDLAAYAWLHARKQLPVRMAYSSEAASRDPQVEAIMSRMVGMQGGRGEHMWGAGDAKLWMVGLAAAYNLDAVPSIAGSCTRKPFPREAPNFPYWLDQFYGPYGLCTLDNPEYNDRTAIQAAAQYGFRVSALHVMGDRALDQYLDLVEDLAKKYPDLVERRWASDHCGIIREEQVLRAKRLGIIFSCGPTFLFEGINGSVGAYKILYGEQEAGNMVMPFRTMLDHGLRPVIELDRHGFHPFLALEVAVNRKDVDGKVWGPQQGVSRREALYMYTRWAAEYVLREKVLGSIEPGKYADFVVLNRDYLTVPEDEIGQIDPMLTVMGGEFTYTDASFAASQGLPQAGYRGDRSHWTRGIAVEKARGRESSPRSTN